LLARRRIGARAVPRHARGDGGLRPGGDAPRPADGRHLRGNPGAAAAARLDERVSLPTWQELWVAMRYGLAV